MSDNIIFSVVIPTYNRADRLRDTLQSVLEQSFGDLEIIVVDDGSTDDTESACHAIDDSRIRYIRQENAGPAAARNTGVSNARGDYIAYLDSDDRWHPDYLADVKAKFGTLNEESFVYGQIVSDRGANRYWLKPAQAMESDESIFDYLYANGGTMLTSSVSLPRALAAKVQWDESITFGDNDQYVIDLCLAGAQAHMLDRALVWYLDIDSADALSQLFIHDAKSERYQRFFTWMQQHYPQMSAQSVAGFEAHFLSGVLLRTSPLASFKLLWKAWRVGTLSFKGLARQTLQNCAPRMYRKLTTAYVAKRGITLEDTPF